MRSISPIVDVPNPILSIILNLVQFEKFKGKKIRIDTTFVDADEAASKILDFLNF